MHNDGGEKGIRTLGGLAPTAVFKTAAIDRSAISPRSLIYIFNMAQNGDLSNQHWRFFKFTCMFYQHKTNTTQH